MVKPLEIAALKLTGDIARAFAQIRSNKIDREAIDSQNPDHIEKINLASIRLLFILLVTLYMEENKHLPENPEFRDTAGIWQIREHLSSGGKKPSGRKYSIINRIRETMSLVYEGGMNQASFRARLFDPENPENCHLMKWKLPDSGIILSLVDLFRLWPHPPLSLLSLAPPDLRSLVDIYSYLLDFELARAKDPMIILNGGMKVIAVNEANQSEIHPGFRIETGQLYYRYAKNKSRAGGTVYTPDEIVERIVKHTLEPLIKDKKNDFPLRILDPACGTGRFLIGALDFLSDYADKNSISQSDIKEFERSIIDNSLYGVDTDNLAVELAEMQLMLRIHESTKPSESFRDNLIVADTLTGIDSKFIQAFVREKVDSTDERHGQTTIDELDWQPIWNRITNSSNPVQEACKLIPLFDSVLESIKNDSSTEKSVKMLKFKPVNFDNLVQICPSNIKSYTSSLHPELYFPRLYFDSNGFPLVNQGFDVIIGNPPYGDILSPETKVLLKKLGNLSGGSGNNDVFRFFVERGLNLLRPDGMLGFIIPNTYLKGKKYRNFRKRILELSYPVEILDFDLAKIFQRDVFTSLLFLKKKPSRIVVPVFITSLDGTLENLKSENLDYANLSEDSWLPSGELYKRISSDKRFVRLDPFIAHIGDVGINYQRKDVGWQHRSRSRIASEIFYEGEKEHPDDLPYLKGEDIERFIVNPKANRWLRHDWKKRIQEGETVSVNLDWAMKPIKILSRQTGDSIIAAMDKSSYLTGRSLHTTIMRDIRYSPYYILALLNSDILNRIYMELTREQGRAQAQVKLSFLKRLPIRTISFDMDEKRRSEILKTESQKLEKDFSILPDLITDLMNRGCESVAHDIIALAAMKITYGDNERQSCLSSAIDALYMNA